MTTDKMDLPSVIVSLFITRKWQIILKC